MFKNIRSHFFRSTLLLPLIVLLLVQTQTVAQDENIPPGIIVILNPHTATLNFWLKNNDTDWTWYELHPGEYGSYRNMNRLKLISDKKVVTERSLSDRRRYKFDWNRNTNLWDIVLVQ